VGKKQDKERMEMLARLGRETIIKYGTYDIDEVRKIDPDHPERHEEEKRRESEQEEAIKEEASSEPISDEDASALAEQILSSNFKVGMSQSDVDAFLNGMQ